MKPQQIVYCPEGISAEARKIFEAGGYLVSLDLDEIGELDIQINWCRTSRPVPGIGRVIASSTTGKDHVQECIDSYQTVFTLEDIDVRILESIRNTAEFAVYMALAVLRDLMTLPPRGRALPFDRAHNTQQQGETLQGKNYYIIGNGRVAGHLHEMLSVFGAIRSNSIQTANIIFVACKYEGECVFDSDSIQAIRRADVVLINVARSELVDIDALCSRPDMIAAYAEDATNPDGVDVAWRKLNRAGIMALFWPHLAGYVGRSLAIVEAALAKVVVKKMKGKK